MCMSNEAREVLNGFLSAEYGRGPDETRLIHIGERYPETDSLHWITAWNPLGVMHDDAANTVAQRDLFAALAMAGLRIEDGFARSPQQSDGDWREPCAVVHAADSLSIDALARRFRQLAVVVLEPEAPARLRCYRALWIERFGSADMDARNVEWVA